VDDRLKPAVLARLSLKAAIDARTGQGGTAPVRVQEQIARLKARLKEQAAWAAHYQGPRC
jgi:argininosuccinate lyase